MSTEVVESCPDFENIFTVLRDSLTHEVDDILLQDGYLFHSHKLCIPTCWGACGTFWTKQDN